MPGLSQGQGQGARQDVAGRSRPSEERRGIPRGRRGDGSRSRAPSPAGDREARQARAEAGWAHVRAGRGRSHLRRHRPPGDPRRGKGATGTVGAGHRAAAASARSPSRSRRRSGEVTGVCSTSRRNSSDRSGRHRDRVHPRGLHGRDAAVGRDRRHRWPPPLSHLRRALAPKGTLVIVGGEGGNRWTGASAANRPGAPPLALLGSAPSPVVAKENQATSKPCGADRSRQGHAGGRQDVSARRCPRSDSASFERGTPAARSSYPS